MDESSCGPECEHTRACEKVIQYAERGLGLWLEPGEVRALAEWLLSANRTMMELEGDD